MPLYVLHHTPNDVPYWIRVIFHKPRRIAFDFPGVCIISYKRWKKKTFNLRVERGKSIFWIMVTLGVLFFHNSAYSCDFFLFSRELSLQQYNTRETDTDNYNIHLKRLFTSELLFYIIDKKLQAVVFYFPRRQME